MPPSRGRRAADFMHAKTHRQGQRTLAAKVWIWLISAAPVSRCRGSFRGQSGYRNQITPRQKLDLSGHGADHVQLVNAKTI